MPNVKSTMVTALFDALAPHYCCSCGEIGALLCESCKYDIVSEPFEGCLLCGRLSLLGKCGHCRSAIEMSWCGGERTGGLEELINRFKFGYAEDAHIPLGDVLLAALPQLPESTVVVPIPTVRAHIRQRGYDHTLLLAKYVARKRDLKLGRVLKRRTSTMQRGASRKLRTKQAKEAYEVVGNLRSGVPYLLVDDVVTTGSTLRYAAKALKDAGATTIWAAASTRQPLD